MATRHAKRASRRPAVHDVGGYRVTYTRNAGPPVFTGPSAERPARRAEAERKVTEAEARFAEALAAVRAGTDTPTQRNLVYNRAVR